MGLLASIAKPVIKLQKCIKTSASLPESFSLFFNSRAVKVGKLDIDQNVDIVAQYKIMSVPTFLVIKDGEVKAKLIGAVSKEELVEAIDQAK